MPAIRGSDFVDSERRTRSAKIPAHRNFALLWAGQSVSDLGSAVTTLALPLTAITVVRASVFEIGLLAACTNIAYLVVALPAGALIDRVSKRKIMIFCDIARMLLIGSVPVAAKFGKLSLAQLFLVAVTSGVFTVFFTIAYQSFLPELVGPERLRSCNSKMSTTQSMAQFVGPSLGGLFVGLIGAASTLAIDAISFAASAVSLTGIAPQARSEYSGQMSIHQLFCDVLEGWRFIGQSPILRKLVTCSGVANFFSAMINALAILFLVKDLHVAIRLVSLLIATDCLGGIVGGATAKSLTRRIGSARLIWMSLLVFGVTELLVPMAGHGWRLILFAIGYAGSGFSIILYNISVVSYRQAACPARILSRVTAANRWVIYGVMPLGGIVAGILGTGIGIHSTLWLAIIGDWAASLIVFFSPLRKMRNIEIIA
jgi:MFS family permease